MFFLKLQNWIDEWLSVVTEQSHEAMLNIDSEEASVRQKRLLFWQYNLSYTFPDLFYELCNNYMCKDTLIVVKQEMII